MIVPDREPAACAWTADADWPQVFDIHQCAAVRLTTGLIPGMAARGQGSVVLMSGISSPRGNRAIGLYGLSKAALAQLARNLVVDGGTTISDGN